MDVSCPQCETIYELDDGQISGSSVSLKCSHCQHLFRFNVRQISEENQHRWMVRSAESGDLVYFSGLDSVYKNIMDRTIDRTDEISRTGNKWVALEAIGEFTPVFQVLDSIASMQPQPVEKADLPAPQLAPSFPQRVKERERVLTDQQFRDAPTPAPGPTQSAPAPVPHPEVRVPLRARADSGVTRRDRPPLADSFELEQTDDLSWSQESEADYASNLRSSRRSKTVWIVLLALVTLAAGIYFVVTSGTFERNPKVISIGEATPLSAAISPASERIHAASESAHDAISETFNSSWNDALAKARGSIGEAVSAAQSQAEKLGKEDTEYLLSRAESALHRSRISSARRYFKKVLSKEPRNSEAITGIGWTDLESGDTAGAAAQFRKALKINPSYGDAYIGLGKANRQLGKYREAYDAYDRYIGRFPKGSKASIARYQLGELEKLIGSKE